MTQIFRAICNTSVGLLVIATHELLMDTPVYDSFAHAEILLDSPPKLVETLIIPVRVTQQLCNSYLNTWFGCICLTIQAKLLQRYSKACIYVLCTGQFQDSLSNKIKWKCPNGKNILIYCPILTKFGMKGVSPYSDSYTLMLCCVSEATPLTRPSERVKALVQYIISVI